MTFFAAAVAPLGVLGQHHSAALDAWLWYLVRDSLAVTHEAVLAAVVDELLGASGSDNAVDVVSRMMSRDSDLESTLKMFQVLPASKSPLDEPLSSLANLVDQATITSSPDGRWLGPLNENDLIRAALVGGTEALPLLILNWLVARKRLFNPALDDRYRNLLSYDGRFRVGLSDVIVPTLDEMITRGISIREACYELAYFTVQQHLGIVWARLEQDPTRDVAIIETDGNVWNALRSFTAGRVASRLEQGIGWLCQLELVDESGCPNAGQQQLALVESKLAAEVAAE
jgi:hypothetical protein